MMVLRLEKVGLIVLLAAAIMVSGCGRQSEPNKPEEQVKVQPGGQLIYGSLQEPNTLNPLLSELVASSEVGSLIFSGLLQMNDKGAWEPDLALTVPSLQNGGVSPDGLTVTYRLRPGVTWHDGTPFSSADVKFTWELIMNRRNNVVSREGYDKIAAVDTPDANTVVIRFREPYVPYLSLFNTILPRHILANAGDIAKAPFNRAPVGTGPFRFKEWRVAEAVVLEANPSYYKGRPTLDGIVYKIIPDTNIMLSQLKAGEVDIVGSIAPTQIDQVKDIKTVRATLTPGMVWEHLDLNMDSAAFRDPVLRQAVSLGIDRQAIVNNVLHGAGAMAYGDQSPLSWAYNPALKAPARDVAAAKELLAQSGWKPGPDGILIKEGRRLAFTLTTTSGNKSREAVAQAIAQQMREIGILVDIRPVTPQALVEEVLRPRRFEAALYAWVASPDPDNSHLWHSGNIPSGGNGYQGQNYPGWRNAEVDNLTAIASRSMDIEARRQAYYRIQDLLVQDIPVVSLYFRMNVDAVQNTVVNYKPSPIQGGAGWNAWQWGLTKKR